MELTRSCDREVCLRCGGVKRTRVLLLLLLLLFLFLLLLLLLLQLVSRGCSVHLYFPCFSCFCLHIILLLKSFRVLSAAMRFRVAALTLLPCAPESHPWLRASASQPPAHFPKVLRMEDPHSHAYVLGTPPASGDRTRDVERVFNYRMHVFQHFMHCALARIPVKIIFTSAALLFFVGDISEFEFVGQVETVVERCRCARVGNDAKRVQSALCTMDENCFLFDPTWAQDVCVKRSMSLSCPLYQAVM